MFKLSIFVVLLVAYAIEASPSPTATAPGFLYIGKTNSNFYFLSNTGDKRTVADARTGCADSFHEGQLVALESQEEHEEVRRRLSSWGIEKHDRVWTTGQHDGSQWVWYDYYSGTITPIGNACQQAWANTTCPVDPRKECLAIGGRDLTYKWEEDNCSIRRRYLCEYPTEQCGPNVEAHTN